MKKIRLKKRARLLALTSLFFTLGANAETENRFTDAVKNSHTDLILRNVFKNLSTQDYGERSNQTAWGQGITLDFKSGYLADMLGVDASYYGVTKLAASKDFWGRSVLYNDNGRAKGFSKMGQIYAKGHLGDEDTYLNAYAGWQQIKKWGAINNSTRAIPSSYLGWRGEAVTGPFRLRGAYVTRYSDRDSPDKIQFLTADKKPIDNIATGELSYSDKHYSALYFFGESHNYMQRQGVELGWKPESLSERHVNIKTQLYMNHGLDSWTRMSTSKKTFDHNAYHAAMEVEWKSDRWKHKVGASYTRASLDKGLGRFEWHLAKHSRGTFNSMADGWGNDYVADNEKMLGWNFSYALLPEVELGMRTNYGWGMSYLDRKLDRGETLVFTRWTPSQPALKNLVVQLSGGPSWNFQSKNNKPKVTSTGKPMRAQNHSIELHVEYKHNLF